MNLTRWRFILDKLFVVFASLAPGFAATSLDVLAPPAQVDTRQISFPIYLKANSSAILFEQCGLTSLVSERGDPLPTDAFKCLVPASLSPNKIETATFSAGSARFLKRGTYSATLQFLGLDQLGSSVEKSISFKINAPAVGIKIGDTDPLRITLTRQFPLRAASDDITVGFRELTDVHPTEVPLQVASELYVQNGSNKNVLPDGSLKASFVQSQNKTTTDVLKNASLVIHPSVPAGVKEASGVIRFASDEFASNLELPVTILVKDNWIYAAIVVVLAQFLSFVISRWFTSGRQRLLNKVAISPVQTSLVNLLLKRPDLIDNSDVAAINGLLDDAMEANELGDSSTAKSSIKAAQAKCDALKGLIAPPTSVPAPAASVFLVQTGYAYVGRPLNFAILNPDTAWTHASMFKWEMSENTKLVTAATPVSTWTVLYEAPNLTTITTTFWRKGQYSLRVSADNRLVDTISLRIDYDRTRRSLRNVALSDYAIALVAVLFGAILSYLAIDKLETFGTVSDYALAFLGGFGLSSTTSGFSTILSRFMTPNP